MSDLAKNLRAYLLTQPDVTALVGTRVYANTVPQNAKPPYLFFQRETTSSVDVLDAVKGETPFYESFSVEAWAMGDNAAETMYRSPGGLLPALRASLSDHAGTFGETSVKLVSLEDYSDDYIPKGAYADMPEGWVTAAFSIDIYERRDG